MYVSQIFSSNTVMKNIALIKSIVATSILSANPAELTEHIAALIQAHPEETRENALAILTGTAELTVRPVDQVELTCSSKQNLCRMFTIVARARLTTLIRSHSSCRTSIRSRKKTVHSWMSLAICGQV